MNERPSPEVRAKLRAWLASEEAAQSVEDWERAIGWTALCFCQWPDSGNVTAYGWWQDPLDCARWATAFQAQMERDVAGDPDAPAYAVIPHPVLPS